MCAVLLEGTDPLQSLTGAVAHSPALAALSGELAWLGWWQGSLPAPTTPTPPSHARGPSAPPKVAVAMQA